jgi:hypothetical protein|tara:strand:- start:1116 stop:2201 length:1086 start_codon:yes stop_codon:yes gene_type:complete
MNVDYNILNKYLDVDTLDLEFHRVTNDIRNVDIDYGVDIIFKYYRKYGFPHYTIRDDEKYTHMKKLQKFDVDTILNGDKIIQTMHCLRLAWTYFPHFWEVRCGGAKMSPMEIFEHDDKFKSTIKKCWNWNMKHFKGEENMEKNKFHENRLRQSIKIYTGTQSVSNFRPTAAKLIYQKYGGEVVWDMSCGWGGRLLGFLTASNTKHYIGTEPSSKTYAGLQKMVKDFSYFGKQVDIYKLGSEEYKPKKESLDLCFTSPPYFDTEKYSDEDTQSYKKFPTKDGWVNGFLRKTIQNCYDGLKDNKYMLINIANTPKYDFIEKETISISKELGFVQEDTLQLTLSSVMGAGYKYEPVFVFRKESK